MITVAPFDAIAISLAEKRKTACATGLEWNGCILDEHFRGTQHSI